MNIVDNRVKIWKELHFNEICDLINKYKIETVCDYGCGSGDFLQQIVNTFSHLKGTGIDCWRQHEDRQKPLSIDRINFIDNSHDNFSDFIKCTQFDLVISTFALHHFKYPVSELKKIEELTKPSGYIYVGDMVTEYTDEYIPANIMWMHAQAIMALKGKYHRIPYTIEEAKDLLRAINTKNISIEKMTVKSSPEEDILFSDYFLEQSRKAIENIDDIKKHNFKSETTKELFLLQKQYHVDLLTKHKRKDNDLMKIIIQRH